MRRHEGGIGCGARGRGSKPRTREAPGPDRAALGPLRREPAGLGLGGNALVPGNADPGNRNRRDGAPRGARVLQKGTRQDGRLVRRLALHPLDFARGREGNTAYPAPLRIRAMTRGCLTFGSDACARSTLTSLSHRERVDRIADKFTQSAQA